MSDDNKDLDIRQEEQERKRKQREKTNKWRKENPEKARELARRQAAKRRAAGKVAKVPKDKKAGYQRKYRRSLKERAEGLIEDLKIEICELEGRLAAVNDLEAKLAIAITWLKSPQLLGQDFDVEGAIDEKVRKNASKHST